MYKCLYNLDFFKYKYFITFSESEGDGGDPSRFLWLFVLAQLCNSLAAAPVFTLGVTYLDDNLSTKTFGLYMGKAP